MVRFWAQEYHADHFFFPFCLAHGEGLLAWWRQVATSLFFFGELNVPHTESNRRTQLVECVVTHLLEMLISVESAG